MLTDKEFQDILDNETKRIEGDIVWQNDEDYSPSIEFRAEVSSDVGWPLMVRGSYNLLIPALSYVLIHKNFGRIYGLDIGKDHHNPQCNQVGEKHKHRWTELYRDKEAYIPPDITAPASDPVTVWTQFCEEAKLKHNGRLMNPPLLQRRLFP